ncbi:MAG: DUF502 domain-containing protein [Deltaproteobacteria bacterium]|nr:MAG: DUF502 domain-containing protein [Deltaproteobacteria bacterium]
MRVAFLAGILVVVPLGATIWVLTFVMGILESTVRLLPDGIQPEVLIGRPIPGLGILLTLTTVMLAGTLTRSFFGRRVIEFYEAMLGRVPIVSSVYQGVKQLTEALFSGSEGQFRQVVLVEWPRRGVYAIAFHTGEAFLSADDPDEELVNVFLPTTPNPTSGFYLMLPRSEIRPLDLTVEEAFKLIMSAGIVAPGRRVIETQEVQKLTHRDDGMVPLDDLHDK